MARESTDRLTDSVCRDGVPRPCRAEMPEFQALWEERGPGGRDDLVILAVDFLPEGTVSAAAGLVEDFELTVPILFDTEDGEVAQRYGVRGLPA